MRLVWVNGFFCPVIALIWRRLAGRLLGPSKKACGCRNAHSSRLCGIDRDPLHLAHCQRRRGIFARRYAHFRSPHQTIDPGGLSVGSRSRLCLVLPPLGIADTVLAQQLMKAPRRLNFEHVVFVERALAHDGPPRGGVSGNCGTVPRGSRRPEQGGDLRAGSKIAHGTLCRKEARVGSERRILEIRARYLAASNGPGGGSKMSFGEIG